MQSSTHIQSWQSGLAIKEWMKPTWICLIGLSLIIHGFTIRKDSHSIRGSHSYGRIISLMKTANRFRINHLKNVLKRSYFQILSYNKKKNPILVEVLYLRNNLKRSKSSIRKMGCSLILLSLRKNSAAALFASQDFSILVKKWKTVIPQKNASKEKIILGEIQNIPPTMAR